MVIMIFLFGMCMVSVLVGEFIVVNVVIVVVIVLVLYEWVFFMLCL